MPSSLPGPPISWPLRITMHILLVLTFNMVTWMKFCRLLHITRWKWALPVAPRKAIKISTDYRCLHYQTIVLLRPGNTGTPSPCKRLCKETDELFGVDKCRKCARSQRDEAEHLGCQDHGWYQQEGSGSTYPDLLCTRAQEHTRVVPHD
jgi:hypothetical protein